MEAVKEILRQEQREEPETRPSLARPKVVMAVMGMANPPEIPTLAEVGAVHQQLALLAQVVKPVQEVMEL